MARFRYDPDIIERFPAVVGGVIYATGVHNDPTPPRLAAAFNDETLAVRTRISETPLSELPTLAAWRKVFRGFGVDPTQYRPAAEALLRRLTKQGELPSIGTLVDLANLVSIRTRSQSWSSGVEEPAGGQLLAQDRQVVAREEFDELRVGAPAGLAEVGDADGHRRVGHREAPRGPSATKGPDSVNMLTVALSRCAPKRACEPGRAFRMADAP